MPTHAPVEQPQGSAAQAPMRESKGRLVDIDESAASEGSKKRYGRFAEGDEVRIAGEAGRYFLAAIDPSGTALLTTSNSFDFAGRFCWVPQHKLLHPSDPEAVAEAEAEAACAEPRAHAKLLVAHAAAAVRNNGRPLRAGGLARDGHACALDAAQVALLACRPGRGRCGGA